MIREIKGFSLFELVVVLTIIGILTAFAAEKLPVWQAQAERASMESVAGSLRSALGIKVASMYAQSDMAGIRALTGSNPMEQLADVPTNYAGVHGGAVAVTTVAGGKWYYDTMARQLVYRIRSSSLLGAPGVAGEIRFAVQLVYDDRNRNGVYDVAVDGLNGVRLVEVQPFAWPG